MLFRSQFLAPTQQQVLCPGIAPVEVRIGRGLLDDKDRLAELQQLVQKRRREIGPAAPFEGDIVGNLHASAAVYLYNRDRNPAA